MTGRNHESLLTPELVALVTDARDRRRAEDTRRTALTIAELRLRKVRHFVRTPSESSEEAASRFVAGLAGAAAALGLAIDSNALASMDIGTCDDELLTLAAILGLSKEGLSLTSPKVDADLRRVLERIFAELLDLDVDLGAFPRRLLAALPSLASTAESARGPASKKRNPARNAAHAMILVQQRPGRSDADIAREVGVEPSTLCRSKLYRSAAAMARGNPAQDRPGLRGGPSKRDRKPKRNED